MIVKERIEALIILAALALPKALYDFSGPCVRNISLQSRK